MLDGRNGKCHNIFDSHDFFYNEGLGVIDAHEVSEVLTLRRDAIDEPAPGGIKLCNITQIPCKL